VGKAATLKPELRKHLLATRRALAPETRAAWDRALCAKVLAWQAENKVATLGVYWPLRDEPDLRPAYDELAKRGVRLLLPVVVAKHTALEFAEWTIGEAMVKDPMGVAVPAELRMAAYPPALLVPCLGYNPHRAMAAAFMTARWNMRRGPPRQGSPTVACGRISRTIRMTSRWTSC
jgi:5,10-methenyltetrahydrofolate synthetase